MPSWGVSGLGSVCGCIIGFRAVHLANSVPVLFCLGGALNNVEFLFGVSDTYRVQECRF